MDFRVIVNGLDVTGPVACLLAAAVLVCAGSFVQWLAPKVARFFVMRGR